MRKEGRPSADRREYELIAITRLVSFHRCGDPIEVGQRRRHRDVVRALARSEAPSRFHSEWPRDRADVLGRSGPLDAGGDEESARDRDEGCVLLSRCASRPVPGRSLVAEDGRLVTPAVVSPRSQAERERSSAELTSALAPRLVSRGSRTRGSSMPRSRRSRGPPSSFLRTALRPTSSRRRSERASTRSRTHHAASRSPRPTSAGRCEQALSRRVLRGAERSRPSRNGRSWKRASARRSRRSSQRVHWRYAPASRRAKRSRSSQRTRRDMPSSRGRRSPGASAKEEPRWCSHCAALTPSSQVPLLEPTALRPRTARAARAAE